MVACIQYMITGVSKCIVPSEITEPPKISGGENHKYDGR